MPDNQFNTGYSLGQQFRDQDNARIQTDFFARVYGWMAAGLAITGAVALFMASSPTLMQLLFSNRFLFIGLLIGELVLVGFLSARINQWSRSQAQAAFIGYAALNGLTMSVIFLIYTASSISSTFFTAALMFGVMSAFGYFTKADLSGWGKLLSMALIGLVIALLINLFWHNSQFNLLISGIGVLLFTALAAYDTQKLKQIAFEAATAGDEVSQKASIMGALKLYLDFINLFLFLLRFTGSRR